MTKCCRAVTIRNGAERYCRKRPFSGLAAATPMTAYRSARYWSATSSPHSRSDRVWMRRKSSAAFRVSRNVAGDGTSFPAIGFLAVEHRHVGLEVAAGREDAACRQVSVPGKGGVLHKLAVTPFHVAADQVAHVFAGRFVKTRLADHS